MTAHSDPPSPTPPPSSPALVRRGLLLATLGAATCGPKQADSNDDSSSTSPTADPTVTPMFTTADTSTSDASDTEIPPMVPPMIPPTTGGPDSTTDGPDSTTSGPDSTTGAPTLFDLNGDFLLAVSTTVDRSHPFQYIATNSVTEMNGKLLLSTCLQPLTLDIGKILTPRQPLGEPLCFADVALVDGKFTLDMGSVAIAAMTNPITGSDIALSSLVLAGTIQSDDLYCGTVTGEVTQPPVGSIEGSSFAAVRLTDVKLLPDPVVIDCKGTSVTDL
ncbi:hypothetical protein [Nannocystis sp.]|uniref:hypothetical protein n=1 Tax=Nannocystis sp. TaxID=1962667 RepID=UPI0025FB6ADF|nr:hypothetical protein [Nannocystis sp.]MBK7827503.1 hypothetical protein [Nannocystis sp.]